MIRQVLVLSAAFALGGCYSMQGAHRILDENLNVTKEVPTEAIFRNDFNEAFTERKKTADVDSGKVRAMLSSGFSHIYAYCDNYFDVMGMQQRKSRVARDTIAPVTAIITGVLALHNFENNPGRKEDMLAVLGLSTAAASSALDIYDEHMLFGADNIGAVEILTKAAHNVHKQKVLSFDDVSFDAARDHLIDSQAICSPQHILSLTRDAIKQGKVVPRMVIVPSDVDANGVIESGEGTEDGNGRVETVIDNDS